MVERRFRYPGRKRLDQRVLLAEPRAGDVLDLVLAEIVIRPGHGSDAANEGPGKVAYKDAGS